MEYLVPSDQVSEREGWLLGAPHNLGDGFIGAEALAESHLNQNLFCLVSHSLVIITELVKQSPINETCALGAGLQM